MANMSARHLSIEKEIKKHGAIGGFARHDANSKFNNDKLYYGPNWFAEKIQDVY